MWGPSPNLSEADIETIGKFVQEGFQANEQRKRTIRTN